MPQPPTLRKLWGIVAFLQELEGMTAEEYAEWEARLAPGDDSGAAAGGHSHAPGTADHSH